MTTIIALTGSLRRASYNTALLRAAAGMCPAGITLDVCSLHGIPVYDGDEEAIGVPRAVSELRDAIKAADAVLIATPEYNNSIPGSLKNGLDWISRPSGEGFKTFGNKPVAVIGATGGMGGTLLAQDALLSVLRAFSVNIWWGGRMAVSQVHKLIDAEGKITDPGLSEQLSKFMAGFATYIAQQAKA